jgi:hypothetical protein
MLVAGMEGAVERQTKELKKAFRDAVKQLATGNA